MDSSLELFLREQYPRYYHKPLPLHFELRIETTHAPTFELRDGQPCILQAEGDGVSKFANRAGVTIDIVDFEQYITNLRTGKASEGKKCDFILVPRDDTQWIILNEISETSAAYIEPFVQPKTGRQQEGKLAHAMSQLRESIDKLSCAPDFIGRYQHRVALFSYRVPEADWDNEATESMKSFLSVTSMAGNISMPASLGEGFVFEQRVYPEEYVIA